MHCWQFKHSQLCLMKWFDRLFDGAAVSSAAVHCSNRICKGCSLLFSCGRWCNWQRKYRDYLHPLMQASFVLSLYVSYFLSPQPVIQGTFYRIERDVLSDRLQACFGRGEALLGRWISHSIYPPRWSWSCAKRRQYFKMGQVLSAADFRAGSWSMCTYSPGWNVGISCRDWSKYFLYRIFGALSFLSVVVCIKESLCSIYRNSLASIGWDTSRSKPVGRSCKVGPSLSRLSFALKGSIPVDLCTCGL